jgi:hypothetical protein
VLSLISHLLSPSHLTLPSPSLIPHLAVTRHSLLSYLSNTLHAHAHCTHTHTHDKHHHRRHCHVYTLQQRPRSHSTLAFGMGIKMRLLPGAVWHLAAVAVVRPAVVCIYRRARFSYHHFHWQLTPADTDGDCGVAGRWEFQLHVAYGLYVYA